MKVDWKKYARSIPDRIQVGPKAYYDILWTENFDGKPYCGTTSFDPKQITLKMGMSPKLTVVTLLHELAHAVSFEFDVNLTENQVLGIEKAFYYALKPDNVFKFKKGNYGTNKRTKKRSKKANGRHNG